jgi:hypothetical protein
MGGACGMHRKIEKCVKVFGGKTCKKKETTQRTHSMQTEVQCLFAHKVPLRSSQHAQSAKL